MLTSQYARLQIAPGYGDITDQLVALTPLYTCDDNADMFKEIKSWNNLISKTIKILYYEDNHNDPMHELPQESNRFIVAVDWFNFKPVKVIKNT